MLNELAIVLLSGAVLVLWGVCLAIAYQFNKRIVALEAVPSEYGAQLAELGEAVRLLIQYNEKSQIGRMGQEQRQENEKQRRECYAEAQKTILAPGSLDEKKNAMLSLVAKYPKVAYGVATQLNRQYHISSMLGISEADLMQMVAQEVSKAMAKEDAEPPSQPPQQSGGWL